MILDHPWTDRSEATTPSGSYLVWSEGRSEACTLAGSRRPPFTARDRFRSGGADQDCWSEEHGKQCCVGLVTKVRRACGIVQKRRSGLSQQQTPRVS